MSPGRVLAGMLLGLAGGLLSELVDRLFHLTKDVPTAEAGWEFYALGAVLGLCIGTGLGITDGLYGGTRAKFWRAVVYGALGGPLCGFIAFGIGGYLYNALGGDPFYKSNNPAVVFQQLLARTSGWALMGILLGTVGGLPGLSGARMRNGAIGGLIGGAIGGIVLESLGSARVFMPFHLRLISFGVTGAAIGFFVGLVGEAFKQAWVKVLIGRNEGREHIIDSPYAVIGRDELADIPVFIDPILAPRQASIRFQDGRYVLFDEAGRQDTRWQGQPVLAQGRPLTDGDLIQVGKVTLVFYEKATASPAGRRAVAPPAPVAIPTPGGAVCEFCGATRDPQTGACACSVAAAAAPPYPPPPAPGYAPGATVAYPAPPAPGYGGGQYSPPTEAYSNPFAPYMDDAGAPPNTSWGAPADPWAAPASAPGDAQLVAIAGPYAGQAFPLDAPVVSIGRDPARELPLVADSTTSRRHASVYAEPTGYVLRDDGSSNGTYVNGQRVMEHLLYPGDEIRIGGTTFRFEA